MKSIEQQVFEYKFPGETYDANNYRDWAKENADEAYKIILRISQKLIKDTAAEVPKIKELFYKSFNDLDDVQKPRTFGTTINDLGHHNTILIAWDKDGNVVYCRTYDYKKEKAAAQSCYDFISQNYPSYVMSAVDHYLHQNNFKPEHL